MEIGMPYMGSLNHVINIRNNEESTSEPLIKTITEMYQDRELNLTVKDFISYMLKDDGFTIEEKNIEKIIKADITTVEGNRRAFLGIKPMDDKGSYRTLQQELCRENSNGKFLLESALVKDIFEKYSTPQGAEYMGLNLIVTGPEGGGWVYTISK